MQFLLGYGKKLWNKLLDYSLHRQTTENQKRFYLSYEKCLPFEMAKFFPSANGKNFCHFKVKSVIIFSIWIVNGTYWGHFRVKLEANISWNKNVYHLNQILLSEQEIVISFKRYALVFVIHFICCCWFCIIFFHLK